ncbi:MAG TPA: RagB/SusD family nutrient uptake outer membrane protein [Mucilaginibacter sp.]|nr:RagB/SusD family nutrient uptake outer membrane protein [Mucilaginibacter sp.]
MKTIYSILTAVLGVALFAGCQKLNEDPKATLTPASYFKTQSDLDASVSSMYVALARDGAWGFTSKETSYFGSDDLTTDPGLNKQDQRDFDRLSGGSTNSSLVAEWSGPWQAIYQANNIIANYQKVNSTTALKNAAVGQCYFIRGLCYYYLVRTFGPLPLVTTNLDLNDRPPRVGVDKIYASIISDLQTAKTLLGTTPASGKPTSYSASACLADVYLTMAGWPLNQTSNYALAAAEANVVISANVYNLSTPYDKVFTTNNTPESIFALQYSVAGGLPNRRFGSTNVPLDEVAVDGSSGWDDVYPEINFFKSAPVCTRTDLTFYTTLKLRNADKTTFTLTPWDSPTTHAQHPYYKKFRAGLNGDGVNETATQILSIQPSTNKATDIIRYPQVLLDYAEAADMAEGGPSAAAYSAINMVRARAGETPLTAGLSQTAFRDAVVFERAYEFAGEFGMRWFDIVRLQLLPQVIAARSTVENSIPGGTNVAQKYLAPIPFSEMAINKQWTQNAGY